MSTSFLEQRISNFRNKNEILTYNEFFDFERLNEVSFLERLFYRGKEIHLQERGEEHYYDRHYNAIIMSIGVNERGSKTGTSHVLTKDLCRDGAFLRDDLLITAPITYVGRNRNSKNARLCYGIAIDIDGVKEKNLIDILHQQNIGHIPQAHMVVNSGNGIHLYFLLANPIALFDESKQLLSKLKYALTENCWNMYTSSIKDKQYQGIFQGFRLPDSKTKFGERVSCFARPESDLKLYSVADLQGYGPERMRLTDEEVKFLDKAIYFPEKMSLARAKELYPDWYERRIVRGEAPRRWHIKRDLYDWWMRRMMLADEVREGHRYFCIMTLAMYALKCDVPFEELERDALSLVESFDHKTKDPENRFLEDDVRDALNAYKECYATFPRQTIEKLVGFAIPANKRNYRKQKDHIKLMNFVRDTLSYPDREWINKDGRPVESAETSLKAKIIREWRCSNLGSKNKSLCARETGLDRKTVRKWWDICIE